MTAMSALLGALPLRVRMGEGAGREQERIRVPEIGNWSGWGPSLGWTFGTLALSWSMGRVLDAILTSRVSTSLRDHPQVWVQTAVVVVRKRLPGWFLLVGVWVAAGYWPLTTEAQLLVGRAVFVLAPRR